MAARSSSSTRKSVVSAALAVIVLSAALTAERVVARELSLTSWIFLTGQVASGPLHLLAEQLKSGASLLELGTSLLIGAAALYQLWRGVSQRRAITLGIAVLVWVLIGYISAVLLWEI